VITIDKYQASLTIGEELRCRAPDSADYARDLWISYWRMADINEKVGNNSSKYWWHKSFQTLNNMKMSESFISKEDEKYLKFLRKKTGKRKEIVLCSTKYS
jgi:hypothetical protein